MSPKRLTFRPSLTGSYVRITIDTSSRAMVQTAKPVQLNPRTVAAFDAYIHKVETEMEKTLHGTGPFLWSELPPERSQQVDRGQVVAQFWSGRGPVKVPYGLIHDWIAAAFIPESTIEDVLAVIQDYNNHKNVYKPEVINAKLMSREGNNFQIYLRLLKKKIITVVRDTTIRRTIAPLTTRAGSAARTQPGLQKWKTPEAETSESCSLIRVTDFCGVCIRIGDSRSVKAV